MTILELVEPGDTLTPSETLIFAMVGAGLSDKKIAHLRGSSVGTVKNQGAVVRKKLGLRSRTQVALAYHGITERDLARALAVGAGEAPGAGLARERAEVGL